MPTEKEKVTALLQAIAVRGLRRGAVLGGAVGGVGGGLYGAVKGYREASPEESKLRAALKGGLRSGLKGGVSVGLAGGVIGGSSAIPSDLVGAALNSAIAGRVAGALPGALLGSAGGTLYGAAQGYRDASPEESRLKATLKGGLAGASAGALGGAAMGAGLAEHGSPAQEAFLKDQFARLKLSAEQSVLNAYGLSKTADVSLPDPLQRALAGYLAGMIPGAVVGGGIGYLTAPKEGPKLKRTLAGAAIGSTITGGLGAAAHGYRQSLVNADALAHLAAGAGISEKIELLRRELEAVLDQQREHAANAAQAKGSFWEKHMNDFAAAAGEKAEKLQREIAALQAQHALSASVADTSSRPVPTYLEKLMPSTASSMKNYLRTSFGR